MDRVNYKALFDSGEIKTLSDLVGHVRQEFIDIYESRPRWPTYTPGSEDLSKIVWYRYAKLEDVMEFGTFCLIWKEKEALIKPSESNLGGPDLQDVSF